MEVVQAKKTAKVIENSQRVAAIQVGIQHAVSIEHDLAMKVSTQTQRFKKPNSSFSKKVTWPPQSEELNQEVEGNLEGEDQPVDEDETLINGEFNC